MKNHHLARATGDAGWSGFILKLEYKAAEKGVHVVKLDQWFASLKTCHCYGYKMPEMSLNKRIWQCPECRVDHDRDINAAINIRQKGIPELCTAGLVVQSVHGGQRKSVIQTVAVCEASSFRAVSSHFLIFRTLLTSTQLSLTQTASGDFQRAHCVQ